MIAKFNRWFTAARWAVRFRRNGWKVHIRCRTKQPTIASPFGVKEFALLAAPPHWIHF